MRSWILAVSTVKHKPGHLFLNSHLDIFLISKKHEYIMYNNHAASLTKNDVRSEPKIDKTYE